MSDLRSVTSNVRAGGSALDVTDQILQQLRIIGGSQSERINSRAATGTIVHSKGPSLQRAYEIRISTAPYELEFKGQVGLFGSENTFYKILIDLEDSGSLTNCVEEPGWECSVVDNTAIELDPYYIGSLVLNQSELDPNYEGAVFSNALPLGTSSASSYVSVKLENLGTGNKYEDANVDAVLYSECRYESQFDQILVPIRSFFYLGIHARNTKRSGYDIKCKIGFPDSGTVEGELPAFVNRAGITREQEQFVGYCP